MANIYISEFSSLNFRDDWQYGFQMRVSYTHTLLPTDPIRVQVGIKESDSVVLSFVLKSIDNDSQFPLDQQQYSSNGYIVYDIFSENNLPEGQYCFQILAGNDIVAESYFCIVEEMPYSVLLTATNYRNEFDAIFEDGQIFALRIPAFFSQSEEQLMSDSEDFRDQRYTIRQLSSSPYEIQVLAIGGQTGVPDWVGRKINMYFSLSDTWIDGIKYVRSDGSTPQIEVINSLYPLFRYKINVEKENTFSYSIS